MMLLMPFAHWQARHRTLQRHGTAMLRHADPLMLITPLLLFDAAMPDAIAAATPPLSLRMPRHFH